MSEIEDDLADYLQDRRNMSSAGDRGWCSRLMLHMRRQDSRIQKLEAELAKHRWVPVSEGLPDEHERVLAFHPDWGSEPAFMDETGWRVLFLIQIDPTHWRRITPPKED